ncbi:MAG: hypothetical protein Kow0063_37070 [Anaerolineae bacterium]
MSTISERWKSTSRVFRVMLLFLLLTLLLLLCLLVFLQFVLPIIRPTPVPTTPVPTTVSPTETEIVTETPETPETPTNTPVVTTGTPGTPETPTGTETPPVTETVTVVPTSPTAVTPTEPVTLPVEIRNLLRNGNFEEGFQPNELGKYWEGFQNGSAHFSYHIDDWPLVVPEGTYAQLIEIKEAQLPDRYLGIYQTANVIPGQVYTFSMQGLVRTNTGDVEKTSYGYRLQVGFDLSGGQDWEAVEDWVELPWDEQLRVQDSFRFDVYSTTLTAESDQLTVFIRAWKKWADSGEGDYDVDDIQLVGPAPVTTPSPAFPVTGAAPGTIWDNVRVWATVALLLLLIAGAVWRLGWRRT